MFTRPERYNTRLGTPLRVNTQTYRALVAPEAQFITAGFARAAAELHAAGLPVMFVDGLPEELAGLSLPEAVFTPRSAYLRAMHYQGDYGLFFFVNEGEKACAGTVTVPYTGPCYWYDAWANAIYPARGTAGGGASAPGSIIQISKGISLLLCRMTWPARSRSFRAVSGMKRPSGLRGPGARLWKLPMRPRVWRRLSTAAAPVFKSCRPSAMT